MAKVGDKYELKIAEVFENEDGSKLYRMSGFNSLVFDECGIKKLKPITQDGDWLNNLKAGDSFDWCGIKWVCLDSDYVEDGEHGVFAIVAKLNKINQVFSKNGSNNYRESDVRKDLLTNFFHKLDENQLISHAVDLISDSGDRDYGITKDPVFLLSYDEYRKYKKYIPKYGDWWTCTPWSVHPSLARTARSVSTSGALNSSIAINGLGEAPACIIRKSQNPAG